MAAEMSMKTISFTIQGNQQDRSGNPLPYFRMTQKSKWTDAAQRYEAWKSYVRGVLYDSGCIFTSLMVRQYQADRPPLVLDKDERAQIAIKVFWADRTHGDLDNILKGILDALFENDKCVNGLKASSELAEDGNGRVEVIIGITHLKV